MKQYRKKLLYVITAIVLLMGVTILCEKQTLAATYTDNAGITYAYDSDAEEGDRVAIVSSYSGTSTEITIPATITLNKDDDDESNDVEYTVIGIGRMKGLPVAEEYPYFANYIADGFKEQDSIGKVIAETRITKVTYEAPANIIYIGSAAFQGCSELTGEAPIPSGVKYIDDFAFRFCSGLNSLNPQEGLESIGMWAFYNCKAISENSIPDSVTGIEEYAFGYCESLSGIFQIPSGVTKVPDHMLHGCESITGIEFKGNVSEIGAYAFAGCSSLSGTFVVPENVTVISQGMLSGASMLTSVVLHDNITEIGSGAFTGCSSLTSFDWPDWIKRIESATFLGCTKLTTIEMPEDLTYIGARAFEKCSALTEPIKIPDEMTEIPARIFYGCEMLTDIELPDNVSSIGKEAFRYCEAWTGDLTSLKLTSVGEYAFYDCKLITGLPVFSEITEIPNAAFYGCSSLSGELVIPGHVKSIGTNAFSGCTGITGLIMEDGVETIGNQAFLDCEGLCGTTLYVPESVTSVGTGAFHNHYQKGISSGRYICEINIFCPQDKQFEEYNKAICVVSYKEEPGDMISLHVERRYLYYEIGETWIDELNIPEEIFGKTVCALTKVDDSDICESLGGYMTELEIIDEAHYFNDWDQIAVESHGRNCTICGNLFTQAHNHPNGTAACSECGHIPFTLTGSLSQKVMRTGYANGPICTVKAICKLSGEKLAYQWYENNAAISGATALTYTVPTGKAEGTYTYTCKVSNGDYSAMSTGLTFTVYKPEVMDGITFVDPSLETPEAGDYVKSTDGKAVYKVIAAAGGTYEVEYGRPVNKNLSSVTIEDTAVIGNVTYNVTSIADNAFKNCKKLKTLKIGNKVKKIGQKAFYGCTGLTKVTGGESLLTIGKSAFQGCKKLKTVSISSKKLKTIGAKTFYGCKSLTKITLKTTKLTKKSVGKSAIKKTNKKLVIKVPKKKVTTYKKYFKGKGNNKAVVKK